MTSIPQTEMEVRLSIENIGGISETTVEFEPGVNILSGRNATNRSSLLRAVMAALGSDDVFLKSDADKGTVELRIGDQTYTRRFVRKNGTVTTEGDPYLEDPELGDLFAFLLATNETRQAVLTDQNIRNLIMRPVDTTAIQKEISSLENEKSRVDENLDELSDLEVRQASLESERQDLTEKIEEKEAVLEQKREEIKNTGTDLNESRDEKQELDAHMSELGAVRAAMDDVRQELRAQRQSLTSLREEREDLEQTSEDLPDTPTGDIEGIDTRISKLRDQQQQLESDINTLQRIIQFNEDNLEGTNSNILDALTDDTSDPDVAAATDKLVDGSETVTCWTCGHKVDRADVEETLDSLRDLRQSKLSKSTDLTDEIEALKKERIRQEEKQRQRQQVTEELHRTRAQIEEREDRIQELETRRDSLEKEIDEIEEHVDELQARKDDAVLTLHKEANQLEVDLNRLEKERENVDQELEEITAQLNQREDLESRREKINAELEDLRTRISQIESEAVETFNNHMDTVLDALSYDNLARIWIERTENEVKKGRRKVSQSEFALHIVRESESGAAYEDTIRHLSESEREVTGLVFALAGYLVHDVHEELPFMLLDSLEAIDSNRIAKLIEHFQDFPDYLVAALLPEDAAAVGSEYRTLTEI